MARRCTNQEYYRISECPVWLKSDGNKCLHDAMPAIGVEGNWVGSGRCWCGIYIRQTTGMSASGEVSSDLGLYLGEGGTACAAVCLFGVVGVDNGC